MAINKNQHFSKIIGTFVQLPKKRRALGTVIKQKL